MPLPLKDCTIALAEGRQLEELAQMLEKEGAQVLRCPMVSILDAPDSGPVLDWLRELQADQFSWVILMTGEALRRLLGFADRDGIRPAVISAFGRTKTLTRGPKPVRALKEIGLTPSAIAMEPTTGGVIATLRSQNLHGKRIGLTLYAEPNEVLVDFLQGAGAKVSTVMPYVYAPAADSDRVAHLIGQMSLGEVTVILFTSSPQVDRLFEVAGEKELESALREGFQRTRVAAVGPVVAQTLHDKQVRVDICPEQGFVMKNLIVQLKRQLS